MNVAEGLAASLQALAGSSIEPVLRVASGADRTTAPVAAGVSAALIPPGSAGLGPAGGVTLPSPVSSLGSPVPAALWSAESVADAAASTGWVRPLSEHVLSMVQHGPQVMRLRLDPPELGGLEISLSLDQDQTNLTFTAQHQFTRDLIEAGLPRLRELLAQGGLALGDFQLSTDAGGGEREAARAPWTPGRSGATASTADGEEQAVPSAAAMDRALRLRLVDDYV